jgi:hypothetical protein
MKSYAGFGESEYVPSRVHINSNARWTGSQVDVRTARAARGLEPHRCARELVTLHIVWSLEKISKLRNRAPSTNVRRESGKALGFLAAYSVREVPSISGRRAWTSREIFTYVKGD